MSNALALKPPSTVKEGIAALIALGVVLAAANFTAVGLKNLLDPSVRSSVVGMVFASVPAIYGFSNRALNGFQPKRLEFPELLPWYVSGMLAGACLFAWIQFIAFVTGAGLGLAFANSGITSPDITVIAQVAGLATLIITAPAAVLAGTILNKSTRGLVFLALLFAAILCVGLSIFTSWLLQPAFINQIMANPLAAGVGVGVPALVVLVFGFGGVIWSAMWRERSIGRLAHAARRLKPDQRDQVFAEITDMLGAQAQAHRAVVAEKADPAPGPAEAA
ncbi:MAG: hypothetical protein ABI740_06120 [Alphaproteobacteria bacterium]